MDTLTELAVKIFIEAILISGVVGYFITKREERLKRTIEEEFTKRDTFFTARFNFKLRSLEELLAPIRLLLMRSKITLMGYDANNKFREQILKECNLAVRGLLLEKGFLIPKDLLPHAEAFIKHYDEWLQAYHHAREIQNIKGIKHVFTFNFPHEAEEKFIQKYDTYLKELDIEGSLL